MALWHNGPLPLRAQVLECAAAWHIHPNQVAPGLMTDTEWFLYWRRYQNLAYKKLHPEM